MEYGLNTKSTTEQTPKIATNALINFRNCASCMGVSIDALTTEYQNLLKYVLLCSAKLLHITESDVDEIFSMITSDIELYDNVGKVNSEDLLKMTKIIYDEIIKRTGYVVESNKTLDDLKLEIKDLIDQMESEENLVIESYKESLMDLYKQIKHTENTLYIFKDSPAFDNIVRNTLTSGIIEVSGFLHINWIFEFLKSIINDNTC